MGILFSPCSPCCNDAIGFDRAVIPEIVNLFGPSKRYIANLGLSKIAADDHSPTFEQFKTSLGYGTTYRGSIEDINKCRVVFIGSRGNDETNWFERVSPFSGNLAKLASYIITGGRVLINTNKFGFDEPFVSSIGGEECYAWTGTGIFAKRGSIISNNPIMDGVNYFYYLNGSCGLSIFSSIYLVMADSTDLGYSRHLSCLDGGYIPILSINLVGKGYVITSGSSLIYGNINFNNNNVNNNQFFKNFYSKRYLI